MGRSSSRQVSTSDLVTEAASTEDAVEHDDPVPEAALKPARALVSIVCNASNGDRLVLESGDTIPEDQLHGLSEGKHYTRAEIKKVRSFVRNGSRKALMLIVGNDEKNNRKEYAPGDEVPASQLAGLKLGVHFE